VHMAETVKFTEFGMLRRVVTSYPGYVDDGGIRLLRNIFTECYDFVLQKAYWTLDDKDFRLPRRFVLSYDM